MYTKTEIKRTQGRPKLSESSTTIRDGFKLTAELKARFDRQVKLARRCKSDVLREMIELWTLDHEAKEEFLTRCN